MSYRKRLFNRWRRRLTPSNVIGLVIIAALLYLVVQPVVEIVVSTFLPQTSEVLRGTLEQGRLTFFYWIRAFAGPLSQRILYEPVRNTLVVSFGFTALAMTVGLVLAWLVVRTDMPFKRVISLTTILPYVIPSWTVALAWIVVFRHSGQSHGMEGVLQSLTGIAVPNWVVYGPLPMIMTLTINYFAFAFLLGSAGFSTIDGSLEESAEINGATRFQVFRRITMPLIIPAIGSAFVLTFTRGLSNFGIPAYLGRPVGYEVMATYIQANHRMGRPGDLYVLTVLLVIMAAVIVYINQKFVGRKRQYTALSGKGSRHHLVSLGAWRKPVGLIVGGIVIATSFIPAVVLFLQSAQPRLGSWAWRTLTLDHWIGTDLGVISGFNAGILRNPRVISAIQNTIFMGLVAGAIGVVIGLLAGYIIARNRGSLISKLVDQLSFMPYVVPGIALGAIYVTLWAQPRGPFPALYGTMTLLVLATVVRNLPFSARTGTTAVMQINRELEEAAMVHGATFLGVLRRCILPLAKQGLLVGFILTFAGAVKDLSLVVLLSTSNTQVMSVSAMGMKDVGLEQQANAMAALSIIIVLVATIVVLRITKGDLTKALG